MPDANQAKQGGTMKKITILCLLIALILTLGMRKIAIAMPIVSNGGFESGSIDPWVNSLPDKWAVVSDRTHSGNFSAYTYTGGSGGVYTIEQSFAPVAVDDITALSFWYYADTSSSPNLAVGLWFDDGSYAQDFIWGITINDWTYRDVMPTLLGYSGKNLSKIGFFDTLRTGLYIDDVTLEEGYAAPVPEPATFLLMGAGLVGFWGGKKRKKF